MKAIKDLRRYLSVFVNNNSSNPIPVDLISGGGAGNMISGLNSTSTLLLAGQSFVGSWVNATDYTTLAVSTLGTNVTGGTIWVDVRPAGATLFNSVPFFKTDITSNPTNVPAIWNEVEGEFRIRYVNGAVDQLTAWWLITKLSNGQQMDLLSVAGGDINGNTPVATTKSVIASRQPDGNYRDNPHNGVAVSTAVNLIASDEFLSAWIDTDGYNVLELFIKSDVISADGGVIFEFTDDLSGTPVVQSVEAFTFAAEDISNGLNLFEKPKMVGFRIRYINGLSAQSSFLLQIDLKTNGTISTKLDSHIEGDEDVALIRSVPVTRQPNGTYKNDPHNGVAISTSATLLAGATFTSDWIDTDGYNVIETFISSDVISAFEGIVFEFTDSLTSPTPYSPESFSFTEQEIAEGGENIFIQPKMVGFRVNYTNGATNQVSFLLQTDLKTNGILAARLDGKISGSEDIALTRSVIAGKDDDDVYRNIRSTRAGDMAVSISDSDLGFHAIVTPGGGVKVAEQTHLVGEPFGDRALSITRWVIEELNGATEDATGAGQLSLDTGTTANGEVNVNSINVARFIPANYNTTHHAVTIPDGASYAVDNSRYWGAIDPTVASPNGVCYELDSGTWYVCHSLNGVVTRIERSNWNGAGAAVFPINSITANVYEIEYNAGSIIYRVNGNVMHRANLLATPFANDIDFPVGMRNQNKNGSIVDVSVKFRAAAIYTLGKGFGAARPVFYAGTGSHIVKDGSGRLAKVIFARSGGGGGAATISIYDDVSAVGASQIGEIDISKDDTITVEYDVITNRGLFIVIAGAGTLGTTITFD